MGIRAEFGNPMYPRREKSALINGLKCEEFLVLKGATQTPT